MENKKSKTLLKSLKRAAVIAFGAVALLGGGIAGERAVEHALAPVPAGALVESSAASFDNRSWAELQKSLPQGDGHPVLVIPGLVVNDLYMGELQSRIKAQGYKVYGWELGVNLGASQENAAKLSQLLQKISAENGGQKVSLVGYSLGGVYAREMAKQHPELVRDVITLGAPFALRDAAGGPNAVLARIHSYFGQPATTDPAAPPPVPSVSVFSRDDYIVGWQASQDAAAASVENIEVAGGHVLLPFNKQAAAVVLEHLARPAAKPPALPKPGA